MTAYIFGAGTVIAKRTDLANTKPAFLGTIQDFEIDFDQTIKTLLGSQKVPVAAGAGELKITCKAKFARIQATTLNNTLLGQTLTTGTGIDLQEGEPAQIPGSGPFTVQVANFTTYTEDFGVFTLDGIEFQPVASAPAPQQYQVNPGTGTYTFNAADAGTSIVIYYQYSTSSGQLISIANTAMGQQPSFELIAKQKFNYYGAQKIVVLKLNACVCNKITFPFKNQDFVISELDIQALADQFNNVGYWFCTE